MKNSQSIVIYKSKYGSSKQYALWISDAVGCKAEDVGNVKLNELLQYDTIVYVGGLYAGSVSGYKLISKNLDTLKNKNLILCMVGATNPAQEDKYQQTFFKNVPEQYRSSVKFFALRGNQVFSKMSAVHRLLMKAPKAMVEKIPEDQRTEDDKQFIESYGKDTFFVEKENIREVVGYIKSLLFCPIVFTLRNERD